MCILRDLFAIMPETNVRVLSPIVVRKFLLVSGTLVLTLCPMVGLLAAAYAAPGLAISLMLASTIFFNISRLPNFSHVDWLVKVGGFIVFVLIAVPLTVIDSLLALTAPVSLAGYDLAWKLAALYLLGPALLEFAVIYVGAMKSVVM